MLKNVLEKHLCDRPFFWFAMDDDFENLTMTFYIDLGYGVKERVVLDLCEEEVVVEGPLSDVIRKIDKMGKSMDNLEKMINDLDDRMDDLCEQIDELKMDDGKDKLYVLDCVKYNEEEDKFVMFFKWDMASQAERERFIEVTKKYLILGKQLPHREVDTYQPIYISRVEPLCLKISGGVVYVWGWYDVQKWKNGIEIPEEAGVYSVVPRILHNVKRIYVGQHSGYSYKGVLILHKNKINIIWEELATHYGLPGFRVVPPSFLDKTDNKVETSKKTYITINTFFSINV